MKNLEQLLLAFFYTDKVFLSRFVAEGSIDWITEEYKQLFVILKEYYLKYGEVASQNIIEEETPTTEDVLFYKSLIEEAGQVKIESSDYPNLIDKIKTRYNEYILQHTILGVRKELDEHKAIEDVNKIVNKTASDIATLYRSHAYDEGTLKDTAKETFEQYVEESKNPDCVKGRYIGITQFDEITNGLRPPDLFLVAGESGTGKSIICMNMAINLWLGSNKIEDFGKDYEFKDDGCNILFFSIEMDYENMMQRIDSNLASILFRNLRDRKLTDDEFQRFKKSKIFQSKYHKQFNVLDIPRGLTMLDIKAKYEEACSAFDPDVIVVDHLGLMNPIEKRGADWLEMGDIAADLHEFNRRNNKITIAAVQANRPAKNGKATYSTNRIGRSEMIPQNASIIIQIENREDEETFSDIPIHITKMRNGEKKKIILYKKFHIMQICDEESLM